MQDDLFFTPKVYDGTPRGWKKVKTMQNPSGFDVPTDFFEAFYANIFKNILVMFFSIVALVALSTV